MMKSIGSFFTDLIIATKGTVYRCVLRGGGFFGTTVGTEDNEGTLAEGSIIVKKIVH